MEIAKLLYVAMVLVLMIVLFVVAQITDGNSACLGATVFLGMAVIIIITVHIKNTKAGNPAEDQKRIEEIQVLLQEEEVKSNQMITSQLQEELQSLQERQTVSSAAS